MSNLESLIAATTGARKETSLTQIGVTIKAPWHSRHVEMQSLLQEMEQCKSVKACIELALTDACGEYEQASA